MYFNIWVDELNLSLLILLEVHGPYRDRRENYGTK